MVVLAGCEHDPTKPIGAPILDSQFGNAVKRARAMQTINPEGVEVNDQGYSGSAAQRAMDRYNNNGVTPSSQNNAAPANGAAGSGASVKAPQ
jgi:hypothetical protein